jgi:type II secretory pathway pseudopilin PulG
MKIIILIVVTAVFSVLATLYAPKLKRVIIQRKTQKNQKLKALIAAEIEKQLKEIINDN